MTTANYNIRLDEELKQQAFAVIERFGLSPAQAIRLFLKQTAETNKLPLTFDYEPEIKPKELVLGAKTIKSLEQGSKDYLAGKLESYPAENAIHAMQELAHG